MELTPIRSLNVVLHVCFLWCSLRYMLRFMKLSFIKMILIDNIQSEYPEQNVTLEIDRLTLLHKLQRPLLANENRRSRIPLNLVSL